MEPVNIGFVFNAPKPNTHQISQRKPELEALARRQLLKIPIDEIHKSSNDLEAPMRRRMVARHYGLFDHLFGAPHFFYPVVDLPIFFPVPNESDQVQPIYSGNIIAPNTAEVNP